MGCDISLYFSGDRTTLMKYYVQKSGCKATLLPELWYPGGFGFALPLHSPYKPYFDQTFVFYNLVITARKRSLGQ